MKRDEAIEYLANMCFGGCVDSCYGPPCGHKGFTIDALKALGVTDDEMKQVNNLNINWR